MVAGRSAAGRRRTRHLADPSAGRRVRCRRVGARNISAASQGPLIPR